MRSYKKCPVCGNKVQKSVTRTGAVAAGAVAAGAVAVAAGAGVPVIGAALLGRRMVNSATRAKLGSYMKSKLIKHDIKPYRCDQCGYSWSDDSDYHDEGAYSDEDYDYGHAIFGEKYNFFLEKVNDIIANYDSLLAFTNSIKANTKSDAANSELLFLKSVAFMVYLTETDGKDGRIVKKGFDAINSALSACGTYGEEYRVVQSFFKFKSFDIEGNNVLTKFDEIDRECPNIEDISNAIIDPQCLYYCYNGAKEDTICGILLKFYKAEDLPNVRVSAKLMNNIGTPYSVIVSNALLSDFFNKGKYENPELSFKYAETVIDRIPELDYSEDIPFHKKWLSSLERLAVYYREGYGTSKNYQLAYEYSKKAADYKSPFGHYSLGLCYLNGIGVAENKALALEHFRIAQNNGYDVGEKVAQLELELNPHYQPDLSIDTRAASVWNKHDIFVSYSRKDSEIVTSVVSQLERAGFSVWIDKDGIESGDAFKSVIVAAIKSCKVVLFFSSVFSNKSQWTEKEINIAVSKQKTIIPIKLDSSEYSDSVYFDLNDLDYIDYSDITKYEKCLDKLIRSLNTKIMRKIGDEARFTDLNDNERLYLDAVKDAYTEGTLSEGSVRILNRLKAVYNLSEERAKELQAMITGPQLTDAEKEYLDAYTDALCDGVVSNQSAKMLNRLAFALGISSKRVSELERIKRNA